MITSKSTLALACSAFILLGTGCGRPTSNAVVPTTAAATIKTPLSTPPAPSAPATSGIPAWARGSVISRVPMVAGEKLFALTFDDGPWPETTQATLDVLAENNVKATFFMVGQEVTRRPEVARAVFAAGHTIGNHSWDHPTRPRDAVRQVDATDAALKKALGITCNLFRPPYGLLKNGMAGQAKREGKPIVIWSASASDWSRPGAGSIASMIIAQATPGGIALLHDGGGDRRQTVAALPRIIRELRAKGYRFVTIPELLARRDPGAPLPAADQKLIRTINR